MLKFLTRKRAAPLERRVPSGVVVYAIGDVHGRVDLLRSLLAALFEDMRAASAKPVLIGLGDYIDRGPNSREVIKLLLQVQAVAGLETHFLRGNHDQVLLDFLDDAQMGPTWGEFGGREALRSYGVEAPLGRDMDAWAAARDRLAVALPPPHETFLRNLEPSFTLGDYFFAHAGARPGLPLDAQDERDLCWIREPFLSDKRAFDKMVVHGHSAEVAIHADDRRIGIDTGAYATGQLTALRLKDDSRSFFYTRRGPAGLEVARELSAP